jgi:hypothetical protein
MPFLSKCHDSFSDFMTHFISRGSYIGLVEANLLCKTTSIHLRVACSRVRRRNG